MATKKYQIQQLQADESLLTLHPETDASIVVLDPSLTDVSATNVAEAIQQHDGDIQWLDGRITTITNENTSLGNRITALENSVGGISGAMVFLGTSADDTPITDGGTEAPKINGDVIATSSLVSGNVVLYKQQEFVWNGSKWELFGDEGSYALKTIEINGHSLTSNIDIMASDIVYELPQTVYAPATTVYDAITTNKDDIAKIVDGTTKVGKAGTADTAGKWTTAKKITVSVNSGVKSDGSTAITGSGNASIDGSVAKTIDVILGDSGVKAGTYSAVTVNKEGIATAGAQMLEVGGTTPSPSLATGGIFFKEI